MIQVLRTLVLSSFLACQPKTSNVVINVTVKTPAGDPVSEALVILNKNLIGDTNAFGTFTFKLQTKQGSKHRIEIKKSGETYYFAPHIELARIPDKSEFEWKISATLYMVPKPKIARLDKKETEEKNPGPIPPTQEPETSFPFESTTFIIPKSHATAFQFPKSEPQEPTAVVEENRPVFTIHVSSAKIPVENAEIYSCDRKTLPRLVCTTNSRGRCVVKTREPPTAMIVRKAGYLTRQTSDGLELGSNLRINLTPGQSVDLTASFNIFGSEISGKRLSTSVIGIPKILETNDCGFVSFANEKFTPSFQLKLAGPSIKGGEQNFEVTAKKNIQELLLVPSKLPKIVVKLKDLRPGNIEQTHAFRYLSGDNSQRILDQIKKSFEKHGIEVLEETANTDADNNKTLLLATHVIQPYITQEGSLIESAFAIFNGDAQLIGTVKSALGATESGHTQAIETLTLKTLDRIQANSFPQNSAETPDAVTGGRWLKLKTEPRNLGLTWQSGTVRMQATDAPVKLDDTISKVTVLAPPGFLNIELLLPLEQKWLDLSGRNTIVFQKDHLANALELAKTKQIEQLDTLYTQVSESHPQWFDLQVLKAAVAVSHNQKDSKTLQLIASYTPTQDDDATRLFNVAGANLALAESDALEKEGRLAHGEQCLKILEKVLEITRGAQSNNLEILALGQRGIAKSILASLRSDVAASADSEADLKEFLRLSEADAANPRTRYLRVAATKNLHSMNHQ